MTFFPKFSYSSNKQNFVLMSQHNRDTTNFEEGEGMEINIDFHPRDALLGKPIVFNQSELNDFVRDLYLPKQYAELLASGLNVKTYSVVQQV